MKGVMIDFTNVSITPTEPFIPLAAGTSLCVCVEKTGLTEWGLDYAVWLNLINLTLQEEPIRTQPSM